MQERTGCVSGKEGRPVWLEPLSQGERGVDQVEKEAGGRFHARVRGCFAGPEMYRGLLYDLPR